MVMMERLKIFYSENNETHIARGNIISEDEHFFVINDRYDGEIKIGKNFIIKIKKDVIDDDKNI
jgi:hypothetical protein